jgi:hypothetical protein
MLMATPRAARILAHDSLYLTRLGSTRDAPGRAAEALRERRLTQARECGVVAKVPGMTTPRGHPAAERVLRHLQTAG